MKRKALTTAFLLALTATACGGSDAPEPMDEAAVETEAAPPAAASTDWFQIDDATQTVVLDITAGSTPDMNYWNFNGYTKANPGTITVPMGYSVVINFDNADPNMAHSIGVEEWQETWAGTVEVSPVFPGAVSSNPGSLTDATMPGESETLNFVAATAGKYSLVCYVPGHANLGMVLDFVVSSDGTSGVS